MHQHGEWLNNILPGASAFVRDYSEGIVPTLGAGYLTRYTFPYQTPFNGSGDKLPWLLLWGEGQQLMTGNTLIWVPPSCWLQQAI